MKEVKSFFKSIAVAFSIYSKIPMPKFDWDTEDMKYHLIFFPFVGLAVGFVMGLWLVVANRLNIGNVATKIVLLAIPVLLTGGLHLDGFMDTMDALSSYKSREEKLKILSDPHIGAFSVISIVVYFMLYLGFVLEILSVKGMLIYLLSFALSRALCGVILLSFEKAKKDGMLSSEDKNTKKTIVRPVLIAEAILLLGIITFASYMYAAIFTITELLFFFWYKRMLKKNFGGISGDTAGYYISMFEIIAAFTVMVGGLLGI